MAGAVQAEKKQKITGRRRLTRTGTTPVGKTGLSPNYPFDTLADLKGYRCVSFETPKVNASPGTTLSRGWPVAMAVKQAQAVVFTTALFLGGCSFAEDALSPSLAATDKQPTQTTRVYQTQVAAAPINLQTSSPTVAPDTGTFVGQKVSSLKSELNQLQAMVQHQHGELQAVRDRTIEDSQRYHGTVAAINARLQVGTTPGNPVLMQQWKEAQAELDRIGNDIMSMNRLSTEVGSTSSMAAYLLNAVQAARGLSGAVEEDHRQLRILEDEVNRTLVSIERLLTELAGDISRQQQYVSNEKSNLNTLAVAIQGGQLYGSSLAVQFVPAPTATASMAALPSSDRPLAVIKFDKPKVQYEGALYTAVKQALERKPMATFNVVAVSPKKGSPGQMALGATSARRNAEGVMRALTSMGLPSNRVRLSASDSSSAATSEVHVYVH